MFEPFHARLLPRQDFFRRLRWTTGLGASLIVASLGVGMTGYHVLGGLAWIDAFLDAAMILSGMGPLSPLHSTAAKLFAGCYAIYCGIALLVTTGIMFSPVVHRVLHKFHLTDQPEK